MTFLTFCFWLFFSVAVGMFASIHRNRSGFGWFCISVLFSPLVGIILVAILRPYVAPPISQDNSPRLVHTEPMDNQVDNQATIMLVIGIVAVVLVVIISVTSAGAQQQVYRDASGRITATATQSGNQTTYRDASGNVSATATTDSGGTTVFRDAAGRLVLTLDRPRR